MNPYHFTSGHEPGDEMPARLMKEVAHDANERQKQAACAYFSEMRREVEIVKVKWAARIKEADFFIRVFFIYTNH